MITPLQQLADPLFKEKQISVFMKRDDLLHPLISGNKWRKLKYNLAAAKELGEHTILTFGGAYSNHIHAVAAAGSEFGFHTIGIIRGEKVLPLNATLSFASQQGMKLHFVSREEYRKKENDDFLRHLRENFGEFYLLPEGGSNALAVKGCAEITSELNIAYDFLCCPVGTGATVAGLVAGSQGHKQVLGFSALKGMTDQESVITNLLAGFSGKQFKNWSVNHDYHFGGFAKLPVALLSFITAFHAQHHILLDPVYTGKMMYGIFDLARKDFFKPGSTLIAIHTGGLQGWNGFPEHGQPPHSILT